MIGSAKWWKRLQREERRVEDLDNENGIMYIIESIFSIRERHTTISREVKAGFLHFVSVAFILSVNSRLLSENTSYTSTRVAASTALVTGMSCLISGFLSNLPFILAPTTSTSIYYAIYLQNHGLSPKEGNLAVFLLGLLFSACGNRSVTLFLSHMIPFTLKVGVCLGVALLIALEALLEINLIRPGEHTVLDIGGQFTIDSYISMLSFIVIGLALHYKIRGAFLIGLATGTLLYILAHLHSPHGGGELDTRTTTQGDESYTSLKHLMVRGEDVTSSFLNDVSWNSITSPVVYRLVFDLYIIGVILLNGLTEGLGATAQLKREDGNLPRGKWLYISIGIGTILSSFIAGGAGPIMISPESAPGIKAGAQSGLSVVVCGILFLITVPFCPLFAAVPPTGTSPVLLMIGMMLFENADKIKWSSIKDALPVFILLVFIPFTYSIFNGVVFGFGVYIILYFFAGGGSLSEVFKSFSALISMIHTLNFGSHDNANDGEVNEGEEYVQLESSLTSPLTNQSTMNTNATKSLSTKGNKTKKNKNDGKQIISFFSRNGEAGESGMKDIDSDSDDQDTSMGLRMTNRRKSTTPHLLLAQEISFTISEINDGSDSSEEEEVNLSRSDGLNSALRAYGLLQTPNRWSSIFSNEESSHQERKYNNNDNNGISSNSSSSSSSDNDNSNRSETNNMIGIDNNNDINRGSGRYDPPPIAGDDSARV